MNQDAIMWLAMGVATPRINTYTGCRRSMAVFIVKAVTIARMQLHPAESQKMQLNSSLFKAKTAR
jgi:hypothetical protein